MKRPLSKSSLFLVHVVTPLVCGGIIYLLFRAESLLMFRWVDAIGAKPLLDRLRSRCAVVRIGDLHWIFFSLPDGLWVYSLTAYMYLIWERKLSREGLTRVLIGPFLALGSEIGQALGILAGTFDVKDLAFYFAGSLLPLLLLSTQINRMTGTAEN